jgi:hypothetical protein
MQTSVLYALSLGLDVEFGGPASWKKKVDEFGTYGQYGQDYWKEKVLNDPTQTWKIELGLNDLQEPESLRKSLGWDKTTKIKPTFVASRLIDVIRDGSIIEKLSYFSKGRI